MSITTTNVKNEYNPVVPTTAFAFTFRWFDLDQIEVRKDGVLLVRDTDYTFSGTTSNKIGGQVDLVTPMSSGTLLIKRVTPRIQEADYGASTVFPAVTAQSVDDKAIAIIQEIVDEGLASEYPLPAPEADTVIGWNATGDALENKTLPDINQYEQLADDVQTAQNTADSALSLAGTADSKAELAKTTADGASSTAVAALAKADANETNLAATETKASTALSKATNNETAIAAIDTNDFVKKVDYEPRISAIEGQQAINTGDIADHEADILSLESDMQDVQDSLAQFTERSNQYIGNNVAVPTALNGMEFDKVENPFAYVTLHINRSTDDFSTTATVKLYCYWKESESAWKVSRLSTHLDSLDGITFSMSTLGNVGTLEYISNNIAGLNYDGQAYYRADKLLS